jgi:ankyrin repeat protein
LVQKRAYAEEQNDNNPRSSYRDEENPNPKVNTVWMLLEHGADVTARDDTHSTPLHLASSMVSPEIVQLLVKHGADVNALDRDHKIPLYLALDRVSVKVRWLFL